MEKIRELKDSRRLADSFGDLVFNRTNVNESIKLYKLEPSFNEIPTKDFNRKFFLVYKGKLRQFKFIKQAHFPFSYNYNSRTIENSQTRVFNAILIKVAGIGETWIDSGNGCAPFDVFESVDDYKEGKTYEIPYFKFTFEDIVTAYSNVWHFNCSGGVVSTATLYRWDGAKVEKYYPKNNITIGFTWDGNTIETGMDDTMYPFYLSKEECSDDNNVEVEYLDDEDDEEPKEKRRKGLFVGLAYDLTEDEIDVVKNFIKSFEKKLG